MDNRLSELRNQRGLTLEQVADASEPPTNHQTIWKLETGEMKLTDEWMHRIAPAFGCPPAALMVEAAGRRTLDRNALSIAVREVLWCIERLESTMAEEEVVSCVLTAYRHYQERNVADRSEFSAIAREVVEQS